ncbi:Negative regulator of toxin gene expression [Clostridioides difficile CD002]|uniref:glycosylating toxin anti-sigma factor TcdC n=1 Tax=Clostridioides difficile TaxID=1496 RepID=UPI0003B289B0|nr:glycosylating toxin anti-sigma factor TcdC [Clostridioides difficile]CCL05893.1 Negative regulator of toxin gene expression [Clostridioides difficile CD002]HBF4604977.1 glycosylating toxin anti-sigma factor TcdC [Clostridioides difficile]HBF4792517.1 glycosylating toxin anti-sigma factor TcdC [Clostridioides difficile]HBF5021739.1 glycosylating toxin anti-sigma factor TcdC [Clostridioides difficile]HBF5057299.1 glycosylating toxin anti-sigma factor TcdC [Clostridioides difficile]
MFSKKNEGNEFSNEGKGSSKKIIKFFKSTKGIALLVFILGVFFGNISSPACSEDHEKVISNQTSVIDSQKTEIETLNSKLSDAEPWFKMKDDEKKAIEAENQRKAEEAKKAEEQRKKEEEEKKGYDTGITYDQLARTPDDYKYKKVKFEGKVIQVIEDGDEVQIRLAVSGNYDKVVLCSYKKSITPSRVLEDDYITIRGISAGTITYESTMGGNITIPGIAVEKIN